MLGQSFEGEANSVRRDTWPVRWKGMSGQSRCRGVHGWSVREDKWSCRRLSPMERSMWRNPNLIPVTFRPLSTAIGRIVVQKIHNGFLWPAHASFELLTIAIRCSPRMIINLRCFTWGFTSNHDYRLKHRQERINFKRQPPRLYCAWTKVSDTISAP